MPKHRLSLILISTAFLLTGCNFPSVITQQFTPAALDVDSNPKAEVFLDDVSIGMTPIKSKRVKEGTHVIKLRTDSQTWSDQIKVTGSAITVVNRDFLAGTNRTAGEVVQVETGQGLAIIGSPIGAEVIIDGQSVGKIPVETTEILPGVHDLTVNAPGYQKRMSKPRITTGYRIIMSVDLAKENDSIAASSSAMPSATTTPEITTSVFQASLPPVSTKPTPTPSPKTFTGSVTVSKTPNGWLRVRAAASTSAAELFKINNGDTVTVLDEKSGWSYIQTTNGQEGWASTQYLQK